MKREKAPLPAKLIATVVIVLLVLIFLTGYIWVFLTSSDYFKIKEVITKDLNPDEFSYLKGKNIFSIDLNKESRHILQFYPESSRILVIRILPDRLFIGAVKRKPIALVKLFRYFALDESGALFYIREQAQELQLPLVFGLESKITSPIPGRRYNVRELALVINLIKEIKKSKELKDIKIQKIDVSAPDSATIAFLFFVESGAGQEKQGVVGPHSIEIKISRENIKDKVAILSGVIAQTKNDLANVKYIDLRFRDPVIKFNDAKTR